MKNIQNAILLSDIHLEWDTSLYDFNKVVPKKMADAVFLAGDVAGSKHALPFIKHLLNLGYVVFYTLGNHEFYKHDMNEVIDFWKNINLENFYFLHDDIVEFDNLRIIGTPLWASVDTLIKHPILGIQKGEIDYFVRQKLKTWADFVNIPQFHINDMAELFWQHFSFLENALKENTDKQVVVMTHFLPSFLSVNPAFAGETTNFVFATELDFLMEQYKIDFWFHGHTHNSLDYWIEKTHVICNPRGYHDINALNPEFNWLKVINFQ